MNEIDLLYIIDDDDIYRYLTEEIINSTDVVSQVKMFPNGADAIRVLEAEQDHAEALPKLIFLDLFMPIMDGWKFLDSFTALKPKLKKEVIIYIVTSSIDPADVARAQTIPAVSDFIIKPITREKFLELIENVA